MTQPNHKLEPQGRTPLRLIASLGGAKTGAQAGATPSIQILPADFEHALKKTKASNLREYALEKLLGSMTPQVALGGASRSGL